MHDLQFITGWDAIFQNILEIYFIHPAFIVDEKRVIGKVIAPKGPDGGTDFYRGLFHTQYGITPTGEGLSIRRCGKRKFDATVITDQLPVIQFGDSHTQKAIRVETELRYAQSESLEGRADDFIRVAWVVPEKQQAVDHLQVRKVADLRIQENGAGEKKDAKFFMSTQFPSTLGWFCCTV
jgi:hypothetical protein